MKKLNTTKIISIVACVLSICFYQAWPVLSQYYDEDKLDDEIKDLNGDIQSQKSRIQSMEERKKALSDNIQRRQEEKASLNNQLAILDNRLAKAELDIELTEADIEKTELEIRKTNIQIAEKDQEIASEKIQISNIIRLVHKQDEVSSLEIMLLNNSLADFLAQSKYLEDINDAIKESLEKLKRAQEILEKEHLSLEKRQDELDKLKTELLDRKKKLDDEKEGKITILSQVTSSEQEYQRLLARARAEQANAAAEIASMEKLVRQKLAELEKSKQLQNDKGFVWPVPKNTITAYFHDPDYPFRKIFEHPAVDIRAGQGTVLRASASGYVARAKSGGKTGYGYIMLVHADGISTVYGHVSRIDVAEEQFVTQGQVIGLSGGLPGTPGAGQLTTGPHLHFEVRKNGIPVDPLNYLP